MNLFGQGITDLINNLVLVKLIKQVIPSFSSIHLTFSTSIDFSFLAPLMLYVFILSFMAGIIYILIKILIIKNILKQNYSLLEITFPNKTLQSPYSTQQLFTLIHSLGKQKSVLDKIFNPKTYSLEIVSSKDQGIRYLIYVSRNDTLLIKKLLLSYLSSVQIKEVNDYLPKNFETLENKNFKITEFKLSKDFYFPLRKQENLEEHDPIAYLTGNMTKLSSNELISFQLVLSPFSDKKLIKKITRKILNENFSQFRLGSSKYINIVLSVIKNFIKLCLALLMSPLGIILYFASDGKSKNIFPFEIFEKSFKRELTSYELEAQKLIKGKLDQELFTTTLRLLVITENKEDMRVKLKGFTSSFAAFNSSFQSLYTKRNYHFEFIKKLKFFFFKNRIFSLRQNPVLSISEVSDIYHFPFTSTTKTEDLVKLHSKELPAPLPLKKAKDLSLVFAKNTYGGEETPIGLTEEERKTHMYIIGRTGSGKTTLMFSMAKDDIEKGKGIAFIDPHGDVSLDLLSCVPEKRINDVIYLNPFDLKYPMGINLLELTPGLDEDDAELEKEVVAEGVVSLFRKVFSKEENANAHRIEYILRNAIHTAFTIENRTIFTVYDLLNNPPFQKQVVSKLEDENLKNFWKFEFGRAGDYQVVKMVGGVTAKIGRFLFSPTAKRILEQSKSTINFNDILNGKILICNLSQGKLGEDTARLLGTTILTKIQQAALKRADIPQNKRQQFHLYVDEFQNFATLSFAKMLSEGRKYGLDVCMAEQSTSQQHDTHIVNIILSNVTTVICFRTGNPIDEQLLLSQLSPYVEQGEIQSLPRYKFYIKMSAIDSEEPFSGETIKIDLKRNTEFMEKLIEASRKNYAIVYTKPKVSKKINDQGKKYEKESDTAISQGGVPNLPEYQ